MSNLTDFFRTVGHTIKFLIHKKCPEKKSAAENFKDISWIQTQLATIFPIFYIFCSKKITSPCGLPANLHPETLSKWLFPQGWNPTDTEVGPRHPEKKSQLHGEWWTVSWIFPPPGCNHSFSQFTHSHTERLTRSLQKPSSPRSKLSGFCLVCSQKVALLREKMMGNFEEKKLMFHLAVLVYWKRKAGIPGKEPTHWQSWCYKAFEYWLILTSIWFHMSTKKKK